MRSAISLVTFAVGAAALVPYISPRDGGPHGEWFTIYAHGPANNQGSSDGAIGQLDDGQNRIGGDYAQGEYRIEEGKIWDKHGRGCILTPPTTQWQCDEGAIPTGGFGIDCHGNLFHGDSWTWWACPVNDDGVWNLYTEPTFGQKKCVALSHISTNGGPPPPKCPAPPPVHLTSISPSSPSPVNHACSSGPGCSHSVHPPHLLVKSGCSSSPACSHTAPPLPPPPPVKPVCSSPTAPERVSPCEHTKSSVRESTTSSSCPLPTASDRPHHSSACSKDSCQKPTSTSSAPKPAPTKCSQGDCSKDKHHENHGPGEEKHCPVNLNGDFEFPHYIVPVYEDKPDEMSRPSLNGTIAPGVHSIYNFDISPSHAGKTCSLIFLWPEQGQLETSAFTYSGHGPLSFGMLDRPADKTTTWKNKGPSTEIAVEPAWPGHNLLIATANCPAGEKFGIEVGQYGDLALNYFQDSNPAPIGLYISVC